MVGSQWTNERAKAANVLMNGYEKPMYKEAKAGN